MDHQPAQTSGNWRPCIASLGDVDIHASPKPVLVPSMTGVEALTTRPESESERARGHCKVGIEPWSPGALEPWPLGTDWAPGRWTLLGNTRISSTLLCGLCFPAGILRIPYM